MWKSLPFVIAAFSGLLMACHYEQNNQTATGLNQPQVIPARGTSVSLDSLPPPVVIPVKNVRPVMAGKPKMVNVTSNKHTLGKSKIVSAGKPSVQTPGTDSFKLPQKKPAVDSTFIAGLPDIVLAKDPQSSDNNPGNFSGFKILQGLEENIIFSLMQDRTGNLWIGTWRGGVSKYDGKSFTNYSMKQGLSSDYILSMLEDKKGNIWFGTWNGGVTRFNGRTFTNYTTRQGLINDVVRSIFEDRSGNIWLATDGGISKYDGITFTNFTDEQGLKSNLVSSILEDPQGNMWFGLSDGGFCKFDGKSFSNYTTAQGLIDDRIEYMMKDSRENLWICTRGGISKFNGHFFEQYSTANGLASDFVVRVIEGEHGDFWVTYEGGGIDHISESTITHFGTDQGLSDMWVHPVLKDNKGTYWFGTGIGVCKFDGNLFTHISTSQGLGSVTVRSIIEDKLGNLWVGTYGGGASRFDGSTIQTYNTSHGLGSNNINSLLQDQKGNIWFSTFGSGICKYNGLSFTNYSEQQGLTQKYILCISEARNGDIWLGSTDGMIKFDGQSFECYKTEQGISNNVIQCSLIDHLGNLWFGTLGGGINKFDGRSFTHFDKKGGLPSDWINNLREDSKGNIWIGTTEGVSKYDGVNFTNYTTEQGLSHHFVNSILEGNQGDMWFGTINGISRLTSSRYKTTNSTGFSMFRNYTYADGFLGVGTWINSIIKDSKGAIWFGASDRITKYHASGDIPDTIAPNMQVSGVLLFDQKINWPSLEGKKDTSLVLSNGAILHDINISRTSKWYNLPEDLKLPYDNNYLTFQFIGITLKKPKGVKYQYKLEGLDEYWSPVTARPEATYSKLSHGDYTFKVKAVNSEGYWSNEATYSFTIRPPWWLTNLAYIGYGILIFLSGVAIDRIQRKRLLEKEKERAKLKELEQAKEIKKAYHELKATQAQLVQKEKMASLGELTAGIAHEIQNPLNFVNNFSEVNKELIIEMRNELDNGNIQDAKMISQDIEGNQEKIIHHGQRADAIVKGMLQHSKTSTGQKELTDINALADEYLRLAYHGVRAQNKLFNVSIKTDFDNNIDKINLIPQDIGRVLLNLYQNAFYTVSEKATMLPEEFNPTVTVSTRLIEGKIRILVQDNGMGIPDKIKGKIFQPFFTTKPTGQGTGLGLSLSYDIIKAHGGELNVESQEGKGSSLSIILPI